MRYLLFDELDLPGKWRKRKKNEEVRQMFALASSSTCA